MEKRIFGGTIIGVWEEPKPIEEHPEEENTEQAEKPKRGRKKAE